MKRWLILEDGTYFEGEGFGASINVFGEIVFTTSMTGYQEAITDQSFNGQIITFTYPMVGNYGVNRDDYESISPTCKGVVVKEHARLASNWRKQLTLDEFLKRKNIPGIAGIDTRALTRKIRQHGTMKASIVDAGDVFDHAFDQLKAAVTNQSSGTSLHLKTLSKPWNGSQYRGHRLRLEAQYFTRAVTSQLQSNDFAIQYDSARNFRPRTRWRDADEWTGRS